MVAYCKLELLKFKQNMNHFELKHKLSNYRFTMGVYPTLNVGIRF